MADMRYMEKLDEVAADSVWLIREKTETYRDSWKARGGQGAWFTTVRPWDRLEQIVERHGGDVLAAVAADPTGADGSALACLRDIRNYTILIEAEARVNHGVGRFGPPVESPPAPRVDLNLKTEKDPRELVEKLKLVARRDSDLSRRQSLEKLGYRVWGLNHADGSPPIYRYTVPGQQVQRGDVDDRSLWPHPDELAAWEAAWTHYCDNADEGTRFAPGTPEDGGHHAAQPVEDAPEASEASSATPTATVPLEVLEALRRWAEKPNLSNGQALHKLARDGL